MIGIILVIDMITSIVVDVMIDHSRKEGEAINKGSLKGMKERGKHGGLQGMSNEKCVVLYII